MMQLADDVLEQFAARWVSARPVVAGFLRAALPDFHEAEDALQEVALACLRKLSAYDPERPFVAWALGMARIEVLRHRRARSKRELIHDEPLLEKLAQTFEELSPRLPAMEEALPECLKRLNGRAAELVRLRYEQALGPSEIAARVGMTAVAVRVALNRIRGGLRECIEKKLKRQNQHE